MIKNFFRNNKIIKKLRCLFLLKLRELNWIISKNLDVLLYLMNMAIDIDDEEDEENEENGVPGCETHIESIL